MAEPRKKKAKRMSRSQVSAAQRDGAKVKREASVVKIDGMEQFTAILKTVQEQQKQILDLIGQTTAALISKAGGGNNTDMAKAVEKLAGAVGRMAHRPRYEFNATRTDAGFKIDATPKQPTKH